MLYKRRLPVNNTVVADVIPSSNEKYFLLGLALLATTLSAWFALVVPPGQPYDEPSWWGTAVFYATNLRLPVLGEPGVSYEAIQGPVYFTLVAPLVRFSLLLFSEETSFYILRFAGSFLAGAAVFLSYLIVRRVVRDSLRVAFGVAALVGLSPTLLMFTGSISNDGLAVVVALIVVYIIIRFIESDALDKSNEKRLLQLSFFIGIAIGVATLTKLQLSFLGLAAAITFLRLSIQLSLRIAICLLLFLGTLTSSGWWFLRNFILYGDITGTAGWELVGVSFPPRPLNSPEAIFSTFRGLVSYLWVPTEYFRNAFEAPLLLKILAAVSTMFVFLGTYLALSGARRGLTSTIVGKQGSIEFLIIWSVLVLIAYFVIPIILGSTYGPRFLWPTMVVFWLTVCIGLVLNRFGLPVVASFIVFNLAVSIWLGIEINTVIPISWIQFN